MSSVHAALSQRKTNTFKVDATANYYSIAVVAAALPAGTAQLGGSAGSVFVCPSLPSTLGTQTGTFPAGKCLTDIGKTLVIQFNDSYTKLQEVKYQSDAITFVTGFVVVESNWNTFPVNVSRV
jgi:hypothetical protein